MITIFGSINLDLIGSVGRLPRPGETVSGGAFATAPGGKGANQALAAARAGANVCMVGAVGQDSFAEEALALLRSGGVNLSRVRSVAEPTGVALILVDAAGENVIAVMPGANNTVSPDDVEGLVFGPDDVLLLQLEVPVNSIAEAAKRARNAGARVLLNFAPFRPEALALLPFVTHLIVNESECELVAGAAGAVEGSLPAQAAALASRYALTVIVTLGKDGVIAVENGVEQEAAALPVQAIDTVGAGDTFCGYLATAFSEGMPLGPALTLAARAASLACTKSGAQPAMPHRHEVEEVAGPLTPA
jgi:ribokinase